MKASRSFFGSFTLSVAPDNAGEPEDILPKTNDWPLFVDYLLKPFNLTRFEEAVQRARDLIANKHAGVADDSKGVTLESSQMANNARLKSEEMAV